MADYIITTLQDLRKLWFLMQILSKHPFDEHHPPLADTVFRWHRYNG